MPNWITNNRHVLVASLFAAALGFIGVRYYQERIAPPKPVLPGLGIAYLRTGMRTHTHYKLAITRHTPGGVAVDDPKLELADATIDAAINAVEKCLQTMPAQWNASQAAAPNGFCKRGAVPRLIDRSSILIKVAPDWRPSKCTGEEQFPCTGEDIQDGCTVKVLRGEIKAPTPECPCSCRHAVQDDSVAIVTPKARLLKAAITEVVTGCENPWMVPLNRCAD